MCVCSKKEYNVEKPHQIESDRIHQGILIEIQIWSQFLSVFSFRRHYALESEYI